ncbi:7235_t:CDS:1, partial [Gigaspora rosea]
MISPVKSINSTDVIENHVENSKKRKRNLQDLKIITKSKEINEDWNDIGF